MLRVFVSIDKDILFEILGTFIDSLKRRREWKGEMMWLGRIIIFHRCQGNYVTKGDLNLLASIPHEKSMFGQSVGKGLPIGNYTSQFFANLYMNELDYFIKRSMKIKKYLRYVDDVVVISENVEKLRTLPMVIDNFLREKLTLRLSKKKTIIQPVKRGIEFLGYFIKPTHTLVKNNVVSRLKNKLRNGMSDAETMPLVNSYFGHFSHAQSLSLRKSICDKLSDKFVYADDCRKINLVSQSS